MNGVNEDDDDLMWSGHSCPGSKDFAIPGQESPGFKQLSFLRRMQIRSVAVGIGGCMLLLLGLSVRSYVMAWIGLTAFALALIMVLVVGGWAWWRFG